MAEPVEAWWRRRQFSRGVDVPYPVGTYRETWAGYPVLVRQYHPQFNAGITLSQIPPAADVLLVWECEVGHLFAATPTEQRQRPGRVRRRSSWCPECAELARPRTIRPKGAPRPPKPRLQICEVTPDLPIGEAFTSACAPRATSAAEQDLRARLLERLDVAADRNAVRVRRPFFEHLEVWPDILLPELRIAVEYDTTGRHGLEHVGRREEADRRKDRRLRAAGWEVVRVRTGKLPKLGPHDVQVTGVNRRTVGMLLEEFRAIRGDMLVDAYSRS